MRAGDRFQGWIEAVAESWKDRMRGWMSSWVTRGFNELMEDWEPEAIDLVKANLAKILNHPATPQDLKDVISTLEAGKKPLPVLLLIPIGVLMLIPTITSIFQPLGNLIRYLQERFFKSARIDPLSAITAWRRDPETYAGLFDDLRDQGWSDERIEALKFVTLFYPAPQDLVRWQAREVFEPNMVRKYGLDDELGGVTREPFYKAGMTDEQITNYWRAHWEHASWQQVVEMLHRGLMTEQDVRDWFRVVEIPPYWRDKLIASSWNVPTRVDVRRFWDMRTIDEARLREVYTAQGYHGKDLDDYVLWTKVYVDFPTLLARWKNGWITLDDVRRRLVELGMPADRAEELLQEKIQAEGATRTSSERDLTKTDIYKGVKQERITRLEGLELLMDLGYDENEASYLLDINVPSDETVSAVAQRELTKADVLKGLKADIISELEARQLLLELRYSAVDVEFLIKLFNATVTPPTELNLKEASKADVLLGVKKGLITPSEGHAMLLDIGYKPDAADFILFVKAEESPFSPVSYEEFKDLTQKWRRAAGMEGKPMTDEIKSLGAEVVRLTAEVRALAAAVRLEERTLVSDEALPETATARLTELRVTLRRAEAELSRVETDYNAKVAEWRHDSR